MKLAVQDLYKMFEGIEIDSCIYHGTCSTCPLHRDYDIKHPCMIPDLQELVENLKEG